MHVPQAARRWDNLLLYLLRCTATSQSCTIPQSTALWFPWQGARTRKEEPVAKDSQGVGAAISSSQYQFWVSLFRIQFSSIHQSLEFILILVLQLKSHSKENHHQADMKCRIAIVSASGIQFPGGRSFEQLWLVTMRSLNSPYGTQY